MTTGRLSKCVHVFISSVVILRNHYLLFKLDVKIYLYIYDKIYEMAQWKFVPLYTKWTTTNYFIWKCWIYKKKKRAKKLDTDLDFMLPKRLKNTPMMEKWLKGIKRKIRADITLNFYCLLLVRKYDAYLEFH